MPHVVPSDCVRCGAFDPQQTLLTSYVAYFRCPTCGAMWNVERIASDVESAQERRGTNQHPADTLGAAVPSSMAVAPASSAWPYRLPRNEGR